MKYRLSSNPKPSLITNYNLLLFDCYKQEDNTVAATAAAAAAARETSVDAKVAAGSLELEELK